MRWHTILALPAVGLVIWIVMAAVAFGDRVGSTWTEATTTSIVNGLVMVCFGSAMFGVFILSLVIGAALASRLMANPVRSGPQAPPSMWDRMRGRGRIPQGWDDETVDSYGQRGGVVRIDGPGGGSLRPMLPGPGQEQDLGPVRTYFPPAASGAFDGMEDGDGSKFGTRG